MKNGRLTLQRVRFYSSIPLLYGGMLLFVLYVFQPFGFLRSSTSKIVYSQTVVPAQPESISNVSLPTKKVIAGKPVRIVVIEPGNGLNIDLVVDEGKYDEAASSWNISDTNAQFALPSVLANDTQGNTLIYGHNNKSVFGYISALHEGSGAYALVYTDNGHIFRYTYQNVTSVKPDDISVFDSQGPPTLTIQTCSGTWFEKRSLYKFRFEKLEA